MNNKNDKRLLSIEVLRILGCLVVIGCHIKLNDLVDGNPVWIRVFFSCLFGDGVAIFWFILGFFSFAKEESYPVRLKKMASRILLPLFVYTMISFYFAGFLINGKPLLESMSHSIADYRTMITRCLFRWQNRVEYGGHLWYLYVYAIVILLFPALAGFQKLWKGNKKNARIAWFCFLALLAVNDFTYNELCDFSHHSFPAAVAAAIFVLAGSIVAEFKDEIYGNGKYVRLGAAMFFVTLAVRVPWLYFSYWLGKGDEPCYWYTSFSLISITGLFFMVLGAIGESRGPEWCRKPILYLADTTFMIYIVHSMVITYLNDRDLYTFLEDVTGNIVTDTIIFQLGLMLEVFLVSFVVAAIVNLLLKLPGSLRGKQKEA